MPGHILSKRVQEILIELGWSKETLAEKSGLPYETIKNIYYGRTADPKISTVMAISEATGYAINCLMGKCQHSPQEKAILRNYRACGIHGKSIIELVAKQEANRSKAERESLDRHSIPCLIPSGDIHQGISYDDSVIEEIFTSDNDAYVAIKMNNNDLTPKYCKGDIILIANRFPRNNEYGVFYKNSKAYIRQYIEEDNQYRLKCIHGYADDMVLKRMDEIDYIGTCCGVIRA